jgi:dienelactone hydrolase
VDLYGGAVAETPDSAQALMGQAMREPSRLVENVRDGRAYLSSEADAPRTALLGWCFGGGMTYRTLAEEASAFDAAVAYYGTPDPLAGEALQALETPILAHFGTQDQAVPIDAARKFRDRMEDAGTSLAYHEYERTSPGRRSRGPASTSGAAPSRSAQYLFIPLDLQSRIWPPFRPSTTTAFSAPPAGSPPTARPSG